MLEYIRSLIAEILPLRPRQRQFRRRSLLDKREAARRSASERQSAAFGRRGEKRPTGRRSRH